MSEESFNSSSSSAGSTKSGTSKERLQYDQATVISVTAIYGQFYDGDLFKILMTES